MIEEEEKQREGSTSENPSVPGESPVDTTSLRNKLDDLQVERLADLHRALRDTEARIDRKLENFKKFVEATEISGRSMAGKTEPSEDEKLKAAAMKLLEGTGLNID